MKNEDAEFFGFIVICLLVTLILTLMCVIMSDENAQPATYTEYTVQNGDTLWHIARQSNGYNTVDTRKIIEDMKYDDHDGHIVPGQTVYVPQY